MYWIDNERVLFLGDYGEKWSHPENSIPYSMYEVTVWNAKTDEKQRYHKSLSRFCYADGRLAITKEQMAAQKSLHAYGTLDSIEKEWVTTQGNAGIPFDFESCREREQKPSWLDLDWKVFGYIPLRPNGGYLIAHYGFNEIFSEPIRWYAHKDAVPVELPWSRSQGSNPTYYAFKDAWLFQVEHAQCYKGAPEEVCAFAKNAKGWPIVKAMVWLYRDGRIEEHSIAEMPRSVSNKFIPFRDGFIEDRFNRDLDIAGLYQVLPKEGPKLHSGLTDRWAISPDGCKLAFTPMNFSGMPEKYLQTKTLKVLELCH